MRLHDISPIGAGLLLVATFLGGWLAAREATAQADPVAVLREGNRLFREGRLEQAYEAYEGGWRAEASHPVLLYNLATTAHHLGRLPLAVLWYRRAEQINPGDPWVAENLEQARGALGLEPYPPPGLATRLKQHRVALYYAAAALAWAGLVLWTLRPRRSTRLAVALGLTGLLVYGLTVLAAATAATPAVLLEDCSDSAADLPAGSEIWLTGHDGDSYETAVHGTPVRCPASAVAPILPVERDGR